MIQTIPIEELGRFAPNAHCAFVNLPITDFENAYGVLTTPSLLQTGGWFQYQDDDHLQEQIDEVLEAETFEDDDVLVLVILDTQPVAGAPGVALPRIYLCPFELADADGSDDDDEEGEEGDDDDGGGIDPSNNGGVRTVDFEDDDGEEEDDDEEDEESDERAEIKTADWLDED